MLAASSLAVHVGHPHVRTLCTVVTLKPRLHAVTQALPSPHNPKRTLIVQAASQRFVVQLLNGCSVVRRQTDVHDRVPKFVHQDVLSRVGAAMEDVGSDGGSWGLRAGRRGGVAAW